MKPKRQNLLVTYTNPAWADWVRRLAADEHRSVASLLDAMLAHRARERNYPPPPPRLGEPDR